MQWAPQEDRAHQRAMLDIELDMAESPVADSRGLGFVSRDRWQAFHDSLLQVRRTERPSRYRRCLQRAHPERRHQRRPRPVALNAIVALSGGVGGSRFARGLRAAAPPSTRLTAVVNTGDDVTLHGLRVSPDVDTVLYALSGLVDEQRGWGPRGDTFRCMTALERLGGETWFRLGDLDLATHLRRTELLAAGWPPSRVTAEMARCLGISGTDVLPMTDQPVETWVQLAEDQQWVHFQEYFVHRRTDAAILGVRFDGIERAAARAGTSGRRRHRRPGRRLPEQPVREHRAHTRRSWHPRCARPGARPRRHDRRGQPDHRRRDRQRPGGAHARRAWLRAVGARRRPPVRGPGRPLSDRPRRRRASAMDCANSACGRSSWMP